MAKHWIDGWDPEDDGFWAARRTPHRAAQPDLLHLRRAPGLLGLADVERGRGELPRRGLRLHRRPAVLARRPAEPGRRDACASRTRWRSPASAVATGRSSRRRAAAHADRRCCTYCVATPGHAVLDVPGRGGDRRPRRRQLRLQHGQHLVLLPGAGRRAGRSASTPPAATSASRSCSSSCRWSSASRRRACAAPGRTCRTPACSGCRSVLAAIACAWLFMDNLTVARATVAPAGRSSCATSTPG